MKVPMSDADFAKVRELLAARAGLVFDESRRDSLAYSLGERVGAARLGSIDDYLGLLSTPEGEREMQMLLNEVTIQETHFFRNPPQFRALRQHVLPTLVRHAATRDRTLRVWSAGCSTGEEPYSVAMLIRELLPLVDAWDIKVIATDVSTHALEVGRTGRYTDRTMGPIDASDLGRWFTREGDEYVIRPEVRELVEFRHHNLVSEPAPFGDGEGVDLLLCRNVTIYFSRETTRRLMETFHGCLRDGGYLFLGHSETLWQISERFRLVTLGDAFVYHRDDSGPHGGNRRTVLPDRRTRDEGPPKQVVERRGAGERRATNDRRGVADRRAVRSPAKSAPPELVPSVAALEEARTALQHGRYAEAAARAAVATALDPLSADAHYVQGQALANAADDEGALDALRKATYVDPSHGFGHLLLAGVLSRLGDTDAARHSYGAAATALAKATIDQDAPELGGRSRDELVALCRQLAR